MFMGEYTPTLDDKGRVAISAKLRKAFGENAVVNRLIVTHGFGKYIMAYREEDWRDFVENKLKPLSREDPKNMREVRFLLGGANECDLDRQGRITLPSYLTEWAEIDRDVVVLGLFKRIEIWNYQVYQGYKPKGDQLNGFEKDLGI